MTIAFAALLIPIAIALSAMAALRYALVHPLVHRPAQDRPLKPDAIDGEDNRPDRLQSHLRAIASVPHNTKHYAALQIAADYIDQTLEDLGYVVTRQEYTVDDAVPVHNIAVRIEPANTREHDHVDTLVIGAHYDSADDSPGANDNGTGVAALLELCANLKDYRPENHRIRLVFFVNEEAPYCKTRDMGSWRFAQALTQREEHVVGMIALETLGYFSTSPKSQNFPFPFNHVYEDRGDFIAFVGLPRARNFTHAATKAFRATNTFPSIGGVAPHFVTGMDLSDHWSFDQFAIPALMITDTAPFRNPYYHHLNDTPDTVNCEALAAITDGLLGMIKTLAPPATSPRHHTLRSYSSTSTDGGLGA